MANETIHGRYLIRSMKVRAEWRAAALRAGTWTGVSVSAATEADAILGVKRSLDSSREEQKALRGVDGYPTALEVGQALAVITMTDAQRAMLQAHFEAPAHILTAGALANAGGYESYVSANSQYGALARKLAEELEWQPPRNDGVPTWTFALATGADGETRAETESLGRSNWRWRLRPEVVQALQDQSQKNAGSR